MKFLSKPYIAEILINAKAAGLLGIPLIINEDEPHI